MSPGLIALGWVTITLISLISRIDQTQARPALIQHSIRPKSLESRIMKTVKMLTKKPFNLDICSPDIRLRLFGKTLNKKSYRFSTRDAMLLVPMLGTESIYERTYVWCRTAALYHSLGANKRTFDVRTLDKFQLDITLRRDDVDMILAPFFPTLALRTESFDAARNYMKRHSKRRVKRKLLTFKEDHWYQGMIPYKIKDPELTSITRDTIKEAIALWEESTCLRFHETKRIFFQPHIFFRKGTGCSSSIGQKRFGQEISVGAGCENVGIVAHEIGHAIGFFHEHSRPDRDRYIEIVEANLGRNAAQFTKLTWDSGMTLGIPYDYASVMHYGGTDFSPDDHDFTIKTKDDDMQRVLGQREGPSFLDIKLANWNYCPVKCAESSLEWAECKHGGYRNPNNCSTCLCPRGLAPPFCDKPSSGKNAECGKQEFFATEGEQILSTPGYDTEFGFYNASCPWLIKASSPGKRVKIKFIETFYFTDEYSTCEDYVEVRYKDISMVGPRLCGEYTPEKVYHSHGPQVLILASTLYVEWWQGFKLVYSEENCGGCSSDAGVDEPVCFRTVNYDCSPETGCSGKGCPPPRKNLCYRDDEYCCDDFDLIQGRCTKQENATTPAVQSLKTRENVTAIQPTTDAITTPKPTTDSITTNNPTTVSAATTNPTIVYTTTPKLTTVSTITPKPTTVSTTKQKSTTVSTTTAKPTTVSATTPKPTSVSTTTPKPITVSITNQKSKTVSTTTPKLTTVSTITRKPTTVSTSKQKSTTVSTTTPKPTTVSTTNQKSSAISTTTPKPVTVSITTPRLTTAVGLTTTKPTMSPSTTSTLTTATTIIQHPDTVPTTKLKPTTVPTTILRSIKSSNTDSKRAPTSFKSTTGNPITTTVSSPTPKPNTTLLPSIRVTNWTSWSSWSECSVSCGLCGERARTRQCLVESCSGPREEKELCDDRICQAKPVERSYPCQKTKPGCTSGGWFLATNKKCQYEATCTVIDQAPKCCVGKEVNGRCVQ